MVLTVPAYARLTTGKARQSWGTKAFPLESVCQGIKHCRTDLTGELKRVTEHMQYAKYLVIWTTFAMFTGGLYGQVWVCYTTFSYKWPTKHWTLKTGDTLWILHVFSALSHKYSSCQPGDSLHAFHGISRVTSLCLVTTSSHKVNIVWENKTRHKERVTSIWRIM